jgi:hypothetical protein
LNEPGNYQNIDAQSPGGFHKRVSFARLPPGQLMFLKELPALLERLTLAVVKRVQRQAAHIPVTLAASQRQLPGVESGRQRYPYRLAVIAGIGQRVSFTKLGLGW